MDRIFNMDNKFFTFMGRVADLMILNVLFIICCIPIVTIGASVTAMYYVTLKIIRNEDSYIARSFFKSFKENFKQSTIVWLIFLAGGILLVLDFMIMRQVEGSFSTVVTYGLGIITLVYAMVLLYVFPVISRFYNTTKNILRNALLMSIRHLPSTLAMLAITVIPVLLTLFIAEVLVYGSVVWIMVGFALIALANSWFFNRIFNKYIPEDEQETDEEEELEDIGDWSEPIPGVTPIPSFARKTEEPSDEAEEAPAEIEDTSEDSSEDSADDTEAPSEDTADDTDTADGEEASPAETE
ncbi:MAG: DUF624 domain-containing protein [Eubacteriales bacterium]|nr:DUF624 domain-containing protein [Eubacteriales bacterium]